MPFIRVTSNVEISSEQESELRQKTADIVGNILGKDPARMMTAFEGGVHLCRGTAENAGVPAAFIECKFFGGPDFEVFKEFDSRMHKIYGDVLNIRPEDLYIKYEVINGWDTPARIFKI